MHFCEMHNITWQHIVLTNLAVHYNIVQFKFISSDLWKHTANDNPDKVSLENAVEILKEVMT